MFISAPFYEKHTQCLIWYFRDERSYGKWIDEYLTLFLSVEDDSLVGIEIGV